MKKRVQNKVLAILLSCMFMIGLFPTVVLAEGYESESIPAEITSANFSGGKGTEEDPYQIANAEDLKAFAAKVNEGETAICGILMSDIDLNPGITFNEDGTYTGGTPEQWIPIGTNGNNYSGTFYGNGKTIIGLYINNTNDDYQGLFAQSTGTIQDLGIVNSYLCAHDYVGGIVGRNGTGSVINCYNTGTVIGQNKIGGIAGYSYSTIQNCYNTGAVTGDVNTVGGVTGHSEMVLENCYNSGTVTGGNDAVGGVVGSCYGTVENCYNIGSVIGKGGSYDSVGGIAGTCGAYSRAGTIRNCYNTGIVNGTNQNVGGIVGNTGRKGSITNSYNEGGVVGNSETGGITGYSSGTIAYCYNIADISNIGYGYVGGICGQINDNGTVEFCYNIGNYTSSSSDANPVVGGRTDKSIVENTYYVSDVENENGGKTTEQFSSGEVAWLLNGDQTNLIWKQNLDNGEAKDNYPVLNGGDVYKVNKYATCNQSDTPVSAYSNTNADISGTHSLIKHDGISATCTALGSLEYWHCETCGKNFADEAGQQELTIGTEIAALGHEIVKTDAKEPTATEPGNIAYWYCQRCGKYFQDEALTQEITKEQTILASTGEMIPSAPQEEQTSEDNSNDSPQTGDNTNIIFLSSVMLIAGAVLIGVYVYIQRRKRNNNL